MPDVIHVLIADDHELVRSGIKSALRGHPEFSVVGEAADGEAAVETAARTRPELVVMDVRMPGLGGIEACREIRSADPSANVLMLTSYADEQAVMAALVAGASGFILKEARTNELLDAMRTVGSGGKILDTASAAAVIERIRKGTVVSEEERLASRLNDRELQILDLIAEGLTNREIGERLYLSEKTVKHHVSDILETLGMARRVQAAAFAIRRRATQPRKGT